MMRLREAVQKLAVGQPARDLVGQVFGTALVLERAGRDGRGRALWRCRCRECRQVRVIRSDALLRKPGCTSKCKPRGQGA